MTIISISDLEKTAPSGHILIHSREMFELWTRGQTLEGIGRRFAISPDEAEKAVRDFGRIAWRTLQEYMSDWSA